MLGLLVLGGVVLGLDLILSELSEVLGLHGLEGDASPGAQTLLLEASLRDDLSEEKELKVLVDHESLSESLDESPSVDRLDLVL